MAAVTAWLWTPRTMFCLPLAAPRVLRRRARSRVSPLPLPPATPPQTMVILNAATGKILDKLPIAGSSDGAVFNPATKEAFSTQGNGTLTIVKELSPTKFAVEQNLQTMNGARTITLDSKTNHV